MIIGLSGKMGSGKSTAVETFKSLNPGFYLVKFAGPLYDIQEYCYKTVAPVYKRPEDFVKDRKLLQYLGTEWGRQTLGENVWVDLFKATSKKLMNEGYDVICDDCRFDNEAEAIKSLGGIIIEIQVNNVTDRNVVTNGIKNHASENGISKNLVDITIKNDNSLQMYKDKLQSVYSEIILKQKENRQERTNKE